MRSIINFPLIITIVVFLFSAKAFAQDFEVAPVVILSNAEPGESETRKLILTNHANTKATFSLQLSDFTKDREGKKIFAPAGSTDYSAAGRITVNPNMIDIMPNEQGEVMVTITVPIDDYRSSWAAIFVQPVSEQTSMSADKQVTASIAVTGRIVVEVYQSPKSNTDYQARIFEFKEIKESGSERRHFQASLENNGSKVVKGHIYLIATNLETLEETKYNPVKTTLLPEENRIIDLYLNNDLAAGKYSLAAILDYGSETSLEGVQMTIEVK